MGCPVETLEQHNALALEDVGTRTGASGLRAGTKLVSNDYLITQLLFFGGQLSVVLLTINYINGSLDTGMLSA